MFVEISFLDIKYLIKYIELITAIIGSIYLFKPVVHLGNIDF
ncbi:hypothetical protein JoomaDRAFT_0334 [Galbibacter orientalis DSM 19592]|uniref:Uncharacterized protein n=1 Tax=Galbibacter orientalis DSM 19592 TaxID=926559 RepID=I3C198_9FLAO|nr:hypothetical protein JoomaDRAFT_0334 [Galbibacter orientalis DSM 19592]